MLAGGKALNHFLTSPVIIWENNLILTFSSSTSWRSKLSFVLSTCCWVVMGLVPSKWGILVWYSYGMFYKWAWRTSGAYFATMMGIWGWIISGFLKGGGCIKGGGWMKGGGWIEVWGCVEDVDLIEGEGWGEDGVWVAWWQITGMVVETIEAVGLDDLGWTDWDEVHETTK